MPNPNASNGSTFPSGIGLFFVRSMSESISLSYHMLMAPDAPAPIDIHKIEMKKKKGCISTGANNIPQIDVKTAKDITLGLSRDTKSPTVLSLSVELSEGLYFIIFVCKVLIQFAESLFNFRQIVK